MKSKEGGKEKNKHLHHVREQVLVPSFESMDEKNNQNADQLTQRVVPSFDRLVENKSQRPYLSTDYNTAKLKYKSTKARVSAQKSAARVVSESTVSSIVTGKLPAETPPTVESGLKALGLIRPLDNKAFEFGLAKGIQLYLVENVKLCGLKKGREKSLLDMVSTLCNHLANRQREIEIWVEFADKIALTSAEKFAQTMHQHQAICCSKDDALNAAHSSMVRISKEVINIRKEICKTRSEVLDILTTIPSVLCVEKLRRQVQSYFSSVKSECKSESCRELEKCKSSHNTEMRRLESIIDRLEITIRVEGEKVKSLQCQRIDNSALLTNQQKEHSSALAKMKEDEQKIRADLQRANEQIRSLEVLVENERIQKTRELHEKDEKMKAELDSIDQKVKHSIKSLVESKNKAVEEARKFKAQLECYSKNSQE